MPVGSAKVRKRPFSCNFCTVLAESYFPKSLTVSTLQRSPRAWCLLLRVPVCYTQDCHLLTLGAPKQKKIRFLRHEHAEFRGETCRFSTRKTGFFDPQHAMFQNSKSPESRVPTGSAATFIPAALSGCRRVSPLFIPARSAQARVIIKVRSSVGSFQTKRPKVEPQCVRHEEKRK